MRKGQNFLIYWSSFILQYNFIKKKKSKQKSNIIFTYTHIIVKKLNLNISISHKKNIVLIPIS